MKALIFIIGLVFSNLSFAQDQNQNATEPQKFVMLSAKMDPHHVPPLSVAVKGQMTIDENQIHFFIGFEKNCPPGYYCSEEMPEPIDVVLPITEQVRGRCLATYVATVDQMPVDGILERVSVRIPTCDEAFESPARRAVEVTYTTEGYDRREVRFKYDSRFAFRPN